MNEVCWVLLFTGMALILIIQALNKEYNAWRKKKNDEERRALKVRVENILEDYFRYACRAPESDIAIILERFVDQRMDDILVKSSFKKGEFRAKRGKINREKG